MARHPRRPEDHVVSRLGWLRAAVLGANDGILSTSSLIIGVASAQGTHHAVLAAGLAGLVAGAMSMAAGEYVSVSSQADSERAEIEREKQELKEDRDGELMELAEIYISRGLDKDLALRVAVELTAYDALASHTRDELGITPASTPRPVQAAMASAAAFSVGAMLPLLISLLTPIGWTVWAVSLASLLFLALLGVVGAKTGGANMTKAAIRVTLGGMLAMAVTAGIGSLYGGEPEELAPHAQAAQDANHPEQLVKPPFLATGR